MSVESPVVLSRPRTLVLKVSGTNCDWETRHAFEVAGSDAEIIHLNQLTNGRVNLKNWQTLVLPGGFSYGDDIASGRVKAVILQANFKDQLKKHIERGKPVVGICNGFQVLVQTGLLPFGELAELDQVQASLAPNNSRHFESRWIHLQKPKKSTCLFEFPDEPVTLPVAHGEGKFVARESTIARIEEQGLVVFRYCDSQGAETQDYPANPNGSLRAIAGISSPEGNIFGLMPHPERFVSRFHHPNWRRMSADLKPDGLRIIRAIVDYAQQL